MFRGFGALAAAGVLSAVGISGCVSQAGDDEAALGSISLPLAAEAPSGARYQLRNATFEIRREYYWDTAVSVGVGGVSSTTGGGGIPSGPLLTINTEDEDPGASSIIVDLEQGGYYVTLLPGWEFEKVQGGTATDVEATLLSSETVYVYVSPHSTTWAQYQFGIGDAALWLNGKLNVSIEVYEDPSEYYGRSGSVGGGWDPTGGQGGAGAWEPGEGEGGAGGAGLGPETSAGAGGG
ncbi:hypothetical protein WMF04_31745 [Sorangium sp. So ce260]|uniref:hypothetical protein n=1 Tax=Sorangium sp. So ce260 TaxID=3133291 RepID=UPI003F62139E